MTNTSSCQTASSAGCTTSPSRLGSTRPPNLPGRGSSTSATARTTYMFMTAQLGGGPLIFADATPTNPGQDAHRPGPAAAEHLVARRGHAVRHDRDAVHQTGKAVATNNNMVVNPSSSGRHHPELDRPLAVPSGPVPRRSRGRLPYLQTAPCPPARSPRWPPVEPGAGNVADYKFDETGGPIALDSSGNGNNASIIGTTTEVGASADQFWRLDPIRP